MIISQNEDVIRRKWAGKLKDLLFSIQHKHKRFIQQALDHFGIDQKRERQKALDKMERKCDLYVKKKESEYERKCEIEITKLNDQPKRKPTSDFISHNKILRRLLIILQLFARLRDSDQHWWGHCISCWVKIHYKHANWWHYIAATFRSVCCNLFNINMQCPECNRRMSDWDEEVTANYRRNLIEKNWIEVMLSLESMKQQEIVNPVKYGKLHTDFIEEEMEYYKPIVKLMLSKKVAHS